MEPEARRHALYTGLSDVLGPDLAASLMSYLPFHPASDLVTKTDFDERIDHLSARIDRLSDRIDRLQTTLLGGFAAMIAALLATGFLG